MPGAVITQHTAPVLQDTIFAIDVETFVKNILRLMGNENGTKCAYWGHIFIWANKSFSMGRYKINYSKNRL